MKRPLWWVLGAAAIFIPLCFAETVSLQDVNNFPELYAGSPIEFEQVMLDGRIKKDMGLYCLGIGAGGAMKERKGRNMNGYTPPFLNKERATFIADSRLAQKLLNEMDETRTYPVKVCCVIERIEEEGNVYWIARVSQIDFCAPGGSITKTVRAE